jgi:hypothetical protein
MIDPYSVESKEYREKIGAARRGDMPHHDMAAILGITAANGGFLLFLR